MTTDLTHLFEIKGDMAGITGQSTVRELLQAPFIYKTTIAPAAAWIETDDSLRVEVWPAPVGEGVLCENDPNHGLLVCFYQGPGQRGWRPVDQQPEDAPILEAWDRLNLLAQRPPDGLYLFVAEEHDIECAITTGPSLDGTYKPCSCGASGELRPVEDVTGFWQSHIEPEWTLQEKARRCLAIHPDAQALRFTNASGDTVWCDRELLG